MLIKLMGFMRLLVGLFYSGSINLFLIHLDLILSYLEGEDLSLTNLKVNQPNIIAMIQKAIIQMKELFVALFFSYINQC